ncbi:MAG: sigma-70 family RNA polymerase sigma factor [Bosea sp.]|uniref:RNA polymerase sigma factor n=1 Tax=Bosea sp. (in: a-proteobacteria) TaxID=1871050 RepID=UPI00239BFC3E|nr:sigma-70 family RNA polymerase sigma factor [Bosea sp. (in: a-proteobacteria)]MCP4738574.1 sigma-70 family RNA polymerase sigma factor [Bosea sp. (in: a-proteobacteria)]
MTDKPQDDKPAPGGDRGDGIAKHHDNAVQHALVEAQKKILQFLRRRLGDRDAADEVLQRFSLRALERASQLHDVRMVRGWLGRILATTIVDHQREAARRQRREVVIDQTEVENLPIDEELDAAICNCLYRILPTLKAEYADIIWRADILGEPRDRVAASLGTSLNNVTVRLHRGRQALRKRLEEMCRTCPVHGFLDCHCEKAEQLRRALAEANANTVPRSGA